VWVPLSSGGLTRSSDAGNTFFAIEGVEWCEAVGFGKAASGSDFPTVYIYGTVDGTTGVFRSTDQGTSWLRVNDDEHEYGGPGDASVIIGDMNVFGRVYMTTAGRGIVYGEPASSTNPETETQTVTETDTDTETQTVTETDTDTETQTVTETDTDTETQTDTDTNPFSGGGCDRGWQSHPVGCG
jgi:hypothetical protein